MRDNATGPSSPGETSADTASDDSSAVRTAGAVCGAGCCDHSEWTEKYRPKNLKEIVGNKKAIHEMTLWADAWADGAPAKRALIIYGPAGVGKTSAVLALAAERGWEPIELNASDQRTADAIEKVAGAASRMTALFSEDGSFSKNNRRLIILDEADNLHGTYDRGGSKAIADVIKKTEHPVILIANDVYGITQAVRGLAEEIPFSAVQTRSIVPAIRKICEAEGIVCSDAAAEKIARNAGGDLRSAVKDLQAAAAGRTEIGENDILTSERDVKETIFKALVKVFKGSDRKTALDAIRSLDETPEEIILWIDENLPTQFSDSEKTAQSPAGSTGSAGIVNPDIKNGYDVLVRADRYLGRVRRRQNYHLWRYAGFLMTVGPMAVRTKEYPGFIKYESPMRWRRSGQNRSMRAMRDTIAVKIASRCRCSMKEARIRTIPVFMKLMKNEEICVSLTASYGFDIDEMMYLISAGSATKKVRALYDRAKALRAPDDDVTVFRDDVPKKNASKDESEKRSKENKKQKTFEEMTAEKTDETGNISGNAEDKTADLKTDSRKGAGNTAADAGRSSGGTDPENRPEETKPEETKPEGSKSEKTTPEEPKSEKTMPEEPKYEKTKYEKTKSEEPKPEEPKPGKQRSLFDF